MLKCCMEPGENRMQDTVNVTSFQAEEQQCQEVEETVRQRAEESERSEKEKREAEEQQAEERQAREAEERRQKEEKEKEEADAAARLAQEREEADAAARVAKEEEEAKRKQEKEVSSAAKSVVDAFLKAEGFKGIFAPRRKCCRSQYPLHRAVEQLDTEVVKALMRCGADQSQKNSARQTPRELAEARNKKGDYDDILAALAAAAPGGVPKMM